MPHFNLQQGGCFNHNAGMTLVKHSVVRLIQFPLSLYSAVRLPKWKTEHKENQSPSLTAKDEGKRLMRDFCKGNVLQVCTDDEPRAGKHRRNRLTGCQNCSMSALQLGHLSFYFLTCSSAQTLGLCTKEGRESQSRRCPLLCLYLQGKDQHGIMQGDAFVHYARACFARV